MADSIYIDLVSNASMLEFPENKTNKFTTKLAKPLELEGDWEIGLLELNHPKIERSSKHTGQVWVSGDISNSYKTNFNIDFSLQDPFADLHAKTGEIVAKLFPGYNEKKISITQDGNKSFTIKNGKTKVKGDYKIASAIIFNTENARYFGFSNNYIQGTETDLEQRKAITLKEKTPMKNDIAPTITKAKLTLNPDIWLNDYPRKPKLPVIIEPNDNLVKIVETANKSIDKVWNDEKLDEKKYPKPKFAMDKNNLILKSGYTRVEKEVDVRFAFDRKSLDLMGFSGQDIPNTSGAQIRAMYQPSSTMSNLIFFYTDIVEEHHVGDIMANSLRGIPIKSGENVNHLVFNPVIYHSISLKRINTVSASILDEVGEDPGFTKGRLHATLHLKRKFI